MALLNVVPPAEECGMTLSGDRIAIHMRIPAERGYIGNAVVTLREFCDHLDIGSAKSQRIILALEEAILNAIEYAYPENPGVVDLQFSVEGSEFTLVVEDFGLGIGSLSPQEGDAGDSDERILGDRGRGLQILFGMSDHTEIHSPSGKGTRAMMLFSLEGNDR